MKFAVVDIETTGGSAKNGRIIEFAVVITDGKDIIDSYQTLINPECSIPPFITSLTGISEDMVTDAPTFDQVAARIDEITKGNIFVAHSVNFDFSFVRNEFQRLGHRYDRKRLCTVRLSRKILPGHKSYSLGTLCDELGITITDRHRAYGDAYATAILMNMLVENDLDKHIEKSLRQSSKETKLPPNLDKGQFERLPETAGVYYFIDQRGKFIYIGKAKNLRKRVSSHFTTSGSLGEKDNLINKIYDLDFVETGNELIALLLESHEIKKYWPEYNRSQKAPSFSYGIYDYMDSGGFLRFSLSKVKKGLKPIKTFSALSEAKNWMAALAREYDLCPKLCGIRPAKDECFEHKIGQCSGACVGKVEASDYNENVTEALENELLKADTFAIIGEGRKFGEKSLVVVDKGIYKGFGYIDQEESISYYDQVIEKISLYKETPEVKSIINAFCSGKSGYEILSFQFE